MNPFPFEKTLIVWWRFGKEHSEDEFRLNPPEVIDAHLRKKVDRFRQTPADDWRWWKVNDNLIVERWDDISDRTGPDTRIYYLLNHGIAAIENIHLPSPLENFKWYIQVADFLFNEKYQCWLMKDLFCDVCLECDNCTYHLFDLPEVAQALDVGLVTTSETHKILSRVDWLVNNISHGKFPFPEIEIARSACKQLGW
jgi:hypothetical protein